MLVNIYSEGWICLYIYIYIYIINYAKSRNGCYDI